MSSRRGVVSLLAGLAALLAFSDGAAHAAAPGVLTLDDAPKTCLTSASGTCAAIGESGPFVAVVSDLGDGFDVLAPNGVFQVAAAADGSLSRGAGCVAIATERGCGTLRGVTNPEWMLETSDGTGLLIGSEDSANGGTAIASVVRDPATGALSQPAGTGYCMTYPVVAGCGVLPVRFAPATPVNVSPDGGSLYALGQKATGWDIVSVTRDPATGALSVGACASDDGTDGAGNACAVTPPSKGLPSSIAAADNAVYVAFSDCELGPPCAAIVELSRSGVNHALALEPGANACLGPAVGCTDAPALDMGVVLLQIFPDGRLAAWPGQQGDGRLSMYLMARGGAGDLTPPTDPSVCIGPQPCSVVGSGGDQPFIFSHDGIAWSDQIAYSYDASTGDIAFLNDMSYYSALAVWRPGTGPAVGVSGGVHLVSAYGDVLAYIRQVAPKCTPFPDQITYQERSIRTNISCSDRNHTEFPVISIPTQPSHGVAGYNNASIIYIPSPGFVGVDPFTIDVSDGTTTLHIVDHVLVKPAPVLTLLSVTGSHLRRLGTAGGLPLYGVLADSKVHIQGQLTDDAGHVVPGVIGFWWGPGQCMENVRAAEAFELGPPIATFCSSSFTATKHVSIAVRVWPRLTLDQYYVRRGSRIGITVYDRPVVKGVATLLRRTGHRWHTVSRVHTRRFAITLFMKKGHTVGTWAIVFAPDKSAWYLPSALTFRIGRALTAARTTEAVTSGAALGISPPASG